VTSSSGAGGAASTFSWELILTGSVTDLRGLAAMSQTVVWASGDGTVLRTVDGGQSWQNVSPPGAAGLSFWDIEAFDSDNAVILASGTDARIYRTQDGGASWTQTFQNTDHHAFYAAIAFSDPLRGLALSHPVGGKFRILRTADGGQSWQLVPPTGMPPAPPNEVAFAAAGSAMVSLGQDTWFGTGNEHACRVFHSHDGGTTWSVATTPVQGGHDRGIFSLAFRDSSVGLAVGGDNKKVDTAVDAAARTVDGGQTWTLVSPEAPAGFRVGSAWLGDTALAVGLTGSDVSTDGGQTWTLFDTGSIVHVDCTQDGTCWASGTHGTIARLVVSQH
jgi:photosystem II stability/assembly factor-like uncharacterized protein